MERPPMPSDSDLDLLGPLGVKRQAPGLLPKKKMSPTNPVSLSAWLLGA